jgi:hypothetical protein
VSVSLTTRMNTNKMVKNISMNRPCAVEVPPASWVRTLSVPGVSACMIAAPCLTSVSRIPKNTHVSLTVIPPRICANVRRAPRSGVIAPTRTMPRDTAGLNSPPETRKKIQALMAREKPKERAMYSRFDVLTVLAAEPACPSVVPPVTLVFGIRATLDGG